MQQIQRPASRQAEQNQFLSQFMDYESCPFCQRSFFRGKLAYHLKLCSQDNPMTKPNASPTQKHKKNSLSAATHYQRCENCKSRIPSFMLAKHHERCKKSPEENNKSFGHIEKIKRKETHRIINNAEEGMQETLFPRIKNYSSKETPTGNKVIPGSKHNPRSTTRNTTQAIRIRQQLRCFRRAEEVQKVDCDFCGRKFSQKAALRHVPICSMLRKKQQQQIALHKKSRSYANNNTKVRISKTMDMMKLTEDGEIKQSISILMPLQQKPQLAIYREDVHLNQEDEQQQNGKNRVQQGKR